MATLVDESEISADALQARIDVALSAAFGLVGTWLPNAPKQAPAQSTGQRELEEHMRRPPRLGLGASVPKADAALAREEAKLAYKLGAKGKKRSREEADLAASRNDADEDDEGESRSRTISAKAKLAPLALEGKKKHKKQKTAPVEAKKPTDSDNDSDAGDTEVPHANGVQDDQPGSPAHDILAKKKKKRRKKKKNALTVLDLPTGSPPPPEMATPVVDTTAASPTAPALTAHTSPSKRDPSASPSEEPASPVSPSKRPSVLNLDGPPPMDVDDEDTPESPVSKKKRRRKKKKKPQQQEQDRDAP